MLNHQRNLKADALVSGTAVLAAVALAENLVFVLLLCWG